MTAAMVDAVAELGYPRTSVAEVIRRAGVSRETFYEQFANKEACFLAAHDAAVESLFGVIGEPDGGDPLERLEEALGAYLEHLRAHPALARTFLIEVYAAGPAALRRRAELQGRIVEAVAGVLGPRTDGERFACEALVAAVSAMVTTRVSVGAFDELSSLRAPLVELLRGGLGSGLGRGAS